MNRAIRCLRPDRADTRRAGEPAAGHGGSQAVRVEPGAARLADPTDVTGSEPDGPTLRPRTC